ncbi:MAG: hypothetical protein Q9213_006370, partial [Squamulea squamosa]
MRANSRTDNTQFGSVSSLIEHLESGACSKGWTIQHVNNLVIRSPNASAYIIWDNVAYFLAGVPRHRAIDEDHIKSVWRCNLCKASYLSRLDLERHFTSAECHRYPDVLRCIHCKSAIDRTSALIRHLDSDQACEADAATIRQVVKDLEEKIGMDGGEAGELKVSHQLRIDASKGKDLIVK